MKHILAAAVAAFAITAGSAQAAELIQNGGFETSTYDHNYQFGADFGGQGVANWTGLGGNHLQFYYLHNPTSENATNQFGDPLGYFYPTFNSLSPNGGAFVGLDGDTDYQGQISQTVNGLVVGQSYKLTFDWAAAQLINRTGDTTETLHVTFGGQSFDTETLAVASGGFSGWKKGGFTFTATQASQVLSFLSVGTPNGLPPIAALDGVSLTAVPEPAAWGMMLMGFTGLGMMIRRRRALAAM
jgi:hypothetical protein